MLHRSGLVKPPRLNNASLGTPPVLGRVAGPAGVGSSIISTSGITSSGVTGAAGVSSSITTTSGITSSGTTGPAGVSSSITTTT